MLVAYYLLPHLLRLEIAEISAFGHHLAQGVSGSACLGFLYRPEIYIHLRLYVFQSELYIGYRYCLMRCFFLALSLKMAALEVVLIGGRKTATFSLLLCNYLESNLVITTDFVWAGFSLAIVAS